MTANIIKVLMLAIVLSMAGACGDLADGGRKCKNGKRCGNSCIAKDKACHK